MNPIHAAFIQGLGYTNYNIEGLSVLREDFISIFSI